MFFNLNVLNKISKKIYYLIQSRLYGAIDFRHMYYTTVLT